MSYTQVLYSPKVYRLLAAGLFLAGAFVAAAADPVPFAVPSTGTNVNSIGQDLSYAITSNTIKETPLIGPAVLVKSKPTQAPGWSTVPGANWIAPDVDQSNAKNGCCAGVVRYRTTFSLKDANGKDLDTDTVVLDLSLAADDSLSAYLNPTDASNPDLAHRIFSQGVFSAPAAVRLTKGFQAGVNTLIFDVTNGGLGPTGLAVLASGKAEPLCLDGGGNPCAPKLEVTPGFLAFATVTAAPYAQSPATFINARNSGGGGPQAITVGPGTNAQCPNNGGSYPFAWQPQSTTLPYAPAILFRAFGTDPTGRTVPPGVYQGDLRVTSGNLIQDVCLIAVIAPQSVPSFTVSKTGLLFNAQVNQATHSQTVPVFTTAGKVDFLVKVKALPNDNFLSVTPTNGTSSGAAGSVTSTLTVSVAPQATAGTHYALIQLTPSPATGLPPAVIGVVYNVTVASPAADLSAAGLVLAASQDSTTPVQGSFSLQPGAGAVSYSVSTSAPFVTLAAASGTLNANAPTPVQFSVDPAKLHLSFNTADIQIQLPNGVTEHFALTVAYLPRLAVAAPLAATTNCSPTQLAAVSTSVPGNFTQPLGWPVVYQARVMDDCANPAASATVVLTFSNGEQPVVAQLEDAATATYTATWTPVIAGPVTITARATTGSSVSSILTGASAITGTVTANKVPVMFKRGTVNNLYPLAGAALAPATVASVYGAGLAPAVDTAQSLPLPTTLQGTSVNVGGIDAPLYSVSDGQINFQVPAELLPYATYPVVISANGIVSGVESITIAAASPGVAAFGDGTLIAQHASYQLVDAAHPAAPNEPLILYLVGMGATKPAVATGQQAPASEPLARLPLLPTVTVDGLSADVAFAGLTPGGIGLYQIVLTVPPGINTSGGKTVVISQNGARANTTTLNVAVN